VPLPLSLTLRQAAAQITNHSLGCSRGNVLKQVFEAAVDFCPKGDLQVRRDKPNKQQTEHVAHVVLEGQVLYFKLFL
jgi:hypothetical protein